MEQQYRNAEGQLSLWQEEDNKREPSWFWRKLPFIVVAIVVGMLYAPLVFAQESKAVVLTQAILCDDEDGIKNIIDVMSSHDVRQTPLSAIDGCGEISMPVPAIVTPTTEYENRYVVVMLATIQIPNWPIQYGYIAWRAKPPETQS